MSKFENVKVGDKVFLCSRGWGRQMSIATVEKVGKIHVTVSGTKFNFNGNKAGSSYTGDYLQPYSEDEWRDYQTELRKERLLREVQNFDWRTAEAELIEKIHALLPKKVQP